MLVMLPAGGARAETPQAHGYWWRLHSNATNVSPPPIVPERGMWVSNDGTGQHAVSAVRFTTGATTEILQLVLTVAGETGSAPDLLACPARSSWKSAEAGTWSDRPASACDVAFAKGQRRDGALVFDVRGLARSGVLDVVILAPADVGTAFSISFERPGGGSVVTQTPGQTPSPTSSPRGTRSSPRPTSGSSVLPGSPATPSQTPTVPPTASPDQEGASSPLGDAVRDLAERNRRGDGNGFLWLLAGVAVAIGVVGWRIRAGRSRPARPPNPS